jgi:LemA protein
VLSYNTAIQKFPGSLVASSFKFTQREYFEAEDAARTTPEVKF